MANSFAEDIVDSIQMGSGIRPMIVCLCSSNWFWGLTRGLLQVSREGRELLVKS